MSQDNKIDKVLLCGLAYLGAGHVLGDISARRFMPSPTDHPEDIARHEKIILEIMDELKKSLPEGFNSSYSFYSKMIDGHEERSERKS